MKENVKNQRLLAFEQGGDGVLKYQGRLCVPNMDGHQDLIMEKYHSTTFSFDSGFIKMYRLLREVYTLKGLKKDIVKFVSMFSNYHQVKVEHQRLGGLAKNIELP